MGIATAIALALGLMFLGMAIIEVQILMMQRELWEKENREG